MKLQSAQQARLSIAFSLLLLFLSTVCFAQAVATQEVDSNTIIELIVTTISDWRTLGYLSGIVGVVNIIVNLTKLPLVSDWIDAPGPYSEDKKWIRPIISVSSAMVLASVAAASSGASLILSIGHGLFAGMSAIGFHELVGAIGTALSNLITPKKA